MSESRGQSLLFSRTRWGQKRKWEDVREEIEKL